MDFIDGCALVSHGVLQGFDGDINADLVTVLETVGDGLGGAVDADGNAFNIVRRAPPVSAFPEKRTTRIDGDSRQGRRALLSIAVQIW